MRKTDSQWRVPFWRQMTQISGSTTPELRGLLAGFEPGCIKNLECIWCIWLGDLKKFPQISFVRWWHPAVHLFHSYNFCSISWNTYHHFQWHSLLDELEQTASQSIKNWISSHWHKTTASQIFWSNKLISQQWYHPSQFLCSQSWLHLWLLTCLSLIKSTLYPNLVIFISETSVEFVIFFLFLQPLLLQIHLFPANLTIAIHFTLASHKQISTNFNAFKIHWHVRVITNTSKYQHITPTLKKLHWLPIKQRIDYKTCLLTYKTLTNQQPTYLYNSLSFPSHSVSTRSSDSLVLSIPYVRSSLGKRAFSVIGPRLWNSPPPPWYPKLIFSTNIPFQTQNTPLQNCVPSLGSFPSPWTVYTTRILILAILILCPIEWHLVLDTGL